MLMKKILLMSLIFAGLASFSTAQAVLPLDISNLNLGKQIQKSTLTQARCDKITKAIENRVDTFEKRKNFNVPAFENAEKRLDDLIVKAEALSYDVANIKADVSILDNKISKLKNDYATFLSKLNDTKDYACDHTDAEVKTELSEARTLLKNIRTDNDDIRNYIKNTIKQDILELKNQKQSN